MRLFSVVARIVGVSQIVLAALFFFAPLGFISWQGLAVPPPDTGYMLAMLAARFLVYGIGMFWIARNPAKHLFWARGMILIQILDLAAGAVYVALGIVAFANAAFPMFNAAVFAAVLYITLNLALKQEAAH